MEGKVRKYFDETGVTLSMVGRSGEERRGEEEEKESDGVALGCTQMRCYRTRVVVLTGNVVIPMSWVGVSLWICW